MHDCRSAANIAKKGVESHTGARSVNKLYNADHDVIDYDGANRDRGKGAPAAIAITEIG
jgi:hypothetical protein